MQINNISIRTLLILLLVFLSSTLAFPQKEKEALAEDSLRLARQKQDSIKIEELTLEIQELKLKEILIRNEQENLGKKSAKDDSIKKDIQRKQIDSLRRVIKGVPLIVEGDTLFTLYAKRGGANPKDRAEKAKEMILFLGKKLTMNVDSVYIFESDYVTDIMSDDKVIIEFTDQDGLWQNTSREELAKQYLPVISNKIKQLQNEYGLEVKIKGLLLFLLVIVVQIALIYLTNKLFRKLKLYIVKLAQTKLKLVAIKDYEFLDTHRQRRILTFIANILKYILILIQLMISISILFSIFPETEKITYLLLSYIWIPAKDIFFSIVKYVPNIFKITLIYIVFKYIIRGLKYVANEIATEKLKITSFYPDWAYPTYYIVRFLLYSFMIILIWPLLPSSESPVFQGVSVFIGLIISLGSTTVIGNLMAGLVITYMRPFRIGDQIKLNETTGSVMEKTPFVTRIRTPKNEIVTIPNSFILSSQTVNYSMSARDYGIIVNSILTVGYEVPWKQVQQLLIEAALKTNGVVSDPKPFVLVKELADFYCCYQINAYTHEDQSLPRIYSELHRNIIDRFNEAGVEIMSPHFYSRRDGNDVMMPPEYKKPKENPSGSK